MGARFWSFRRQQELSGAGDGTCSVAVIHSLQLSLVSYSTLAWSLAGHAVALEGRVNIRHGLLVALSYVSESPASERPAHHASRVGFSAMMVRVHLTSLRLKGSTRTPLCGDEERPVRLRTTGGLAAARSGDPQSIRVTRAPEAPRPLRRIPNNRTGEGRSMAHANADAGAGATTPSACLQHPQRRRWSATRGAYPNCAQACDAHVKCAGARVPAARRVERASQRRLSDVAAQWQRRSTRALTKCCVARSGHSRRRSRPCSR